MPLTPVPISTLPDATLPMSGTEEIPLVQSGVTKKAALSDVVSTANFGPEFSLALVAGNNNDIPVAGGRALFDTTAGDATVTGFDATSVIDGQLLLVTNRGANALIIAAENAGSIVANRILAVTDITFPSGGSTLLSYSGTLLRWVMV